jgi:polynucleotide 5'-hydroxyl-kinase GRC3/NOL9
LRERFSLDYEVRETILEPQNRVIMVIGASDTGKTTLVEDLLTLIAGTFNKVAVIDGDIGQSHLGPPTTIGWGLVQNKFESWKKTPLRDFYFTGATSPLGNMLPTVVGAKLISEIAKNHAEKVVMDTTGMVRGSAGKALKISKIDLIRPQLILALEREDELEHILIFFRGMRLPRIHRIPVPFGIIQKTHSDRSGYRERRFRDYFKNAKRISFSLDEIGLRNTESEACPQSQLISLRNREGRDLALGIVEEINFEKGEIIVYAPLKETEEIGGIVLGSLRINLEGKQIYPASS